MLTITLYRNANAQQPLVFQSRALDGLYCGLVDWLERNNHCTDSLGADGLTIGKPDTEGTIVLLWSHDLEHDQGGWWEIDGLRPEGGYEVFDTWGAARDAFVVEAFKSIGAVIMLYRLRVSTDADAKGYLRAVIGVANLMLIDDIHHPDVDTFLLLRAAQTKAAMLRGQGYAVAIVDQHGTVMA